MHAPVFFLDETVINHEKIVFLIEAFQAVCLNITADIIFKQCNIKVNGWIIKGKKDFLIRRVLFSEYSDQFLRNSHITRSQTFIFNHA
jgi:hypothetical protein